MEGLYVLCTYNMAKAKRVMYMYICWYLCLCIYLMNLCTFMLHSVDLVPYCMGNTRRGYWCGVDNVSAFKIRIFRWRLMVMNELILILLNSIASHNYSINLANFNCIKWYFRKDMENAATTTMIFWLFRYFISFVSK